MIRTPCLRIPASLEPLEARITPAIVLANPLADIIAGSGKTGATVDLSEMLDAAAAFPNHTLVEFTTNLDTDLATAGIQSGKIVIELFDDAAPRSVQNFLAYVNSTSAKGDYDNTIIHRSFDFGGTSEAGIDIVQGGGFDLTALQSHLVTGPTVHNEYSASRPNERGTIAMAKVGGDPHSATSEWFFNLTDNTSILGGDNNGGFTVFGRVVSGLEIVDQIGQLTTYDLSGLKSLNPALTDLPLQNYDADPDSNATTPAPKPAADQFVRIVEAKVVPSTGSTSGVTFTVDSITPVDTKTPGDLLTATVSGQTLDFKYAAGKSGFVDVKVKATPSDGTEPVFDTIRVDVRPNLIIDITSDGLQGIVIPGDTAKVKLDVTNNGAAAAIGTADILVGLIKTTATRNASGAITGFTTDPAATPITLATLTGVSLNLAGGKDASFSTTVQIPAGFAPEDAAADIEGTVYRLIAQVTPKTGDLAKIYDDGRANERFSDDNRELLGNLHHALNRFGTFDDPLSTNAFGARKNAVLTYIEDNGTAADETDDFLVSWSVKGAGFGTLSLSAAGGVTLQTSATTAASTLAAKVSKSGVHAPLEGAQLNATLGAANLGSVDLQDYLFAPGGVRSLTLGDVDGPATMLIGTFPPDNTTKTTLKFGRIQDLTLESQMPIGSLTAIDWRNTTGVKDALSTLALGKLKITGASGVAGDFEADVTIGDPTPIAAIDIAGFLRDSTIHAAGDINAVTLGGMERSSVFAGADVRPGALTDFTDSLTISKFTIKGIKGFLGDLFIDSQVAAANLGTIKVTGVATTSGTSDFGFVADAIKNYNRTGVKTASKLSEPQVVEDVGNYVVQVL